MVKYMFQMPTDADFEMLYGNLKAQESIKFWSTSFIRGTTSVSYTHLTLPTNREV